MTLAEFTLPEVKVHAQVARFFREGGADMVEIAFVGSKDTTIRKVTPELMARFKAEWDAFCDGRTPARRGGTPLTDLAQIDDARAADYVGRNVHTLEELAALSDGQCQVLGHGTLTDRQHARALVQRRQLQERDRLSREVQEKSAAIGPHCAQTYETDLEALRADIAELRSTIVDMLAGRVAAPSESSPRRRRESRPRNTPSSKKVSS